MSDFISELEEQKPAFVVTDKHRQAASKFKTAAVFDLDTTMEFGGEIMSGLDEKALAMWLAYHLPDCSAAVRKLREACKLLFAADRADFYEIRGRDDDGHPLNAEGVARKAILAALEETKEYDA